MHWSSVHFDTVAKLMVCNTTILLKMPEWLGMNIRSYVYEDYASLEFERWQLSLN